MSAPFVRFFPIGLVLFTFVLAASSTDGAPIVNVLDDVIPDHESRLMCPVEGCTKGYLYLKGLTEHCRDVHKTSLKGLLRDYHLDYPVVKSVVKTSSKCHKCPVEECSEQFTSSHKLMDHYFGKHPEHAATGTMYDNRYKCPVEECSKQYADTYFLMFHYFGKHPEHAATGTMYDNRFKCPFVGCPPGSAVFQRLRKLQEHCRTEHRYELKYERRQHCQYCPDGTNGQLYWSFQLIDHFKTKHPSFICDVSGCELVFFRQSELTKHRMSCGEQSGRPGSQPPSASSNPFEPTTESTTEPIGTSFGTGPQYTVAGSISDCNPQSSYQSPVPWWDHALGSSTDTNWADFQYHSDGFGSRSGAGPSNLEQNTDPEGYNTFQPESELSGWQPPSALSIPFEPTTESTTEPIGTSFGTGPQYMVAGYWSNPDVSGPGFDQMQCDPDIESFVDHCLADADQEGMLPDPSSSPAVDRHTGPWRTP